MRNHKLSSPVVRELVDYAISKGFTWSGRLSGKGHVILRHAGSGGVVVLSGTPSKSPNFLNIGKRTIDREAERGR